MPSIKYTRESLILEYNRLFPQLQMAVGQGISQWLRPRRTVARHGTCGSVLYWSFWDHRQRGLGVDPVYFTYAISYDPIQPPNRQRFELSQFDWAIVLHMNTVRSYYGPFDLRGFLATHMPKAVPDGFVWQSHPRQFRVIQEFAFNGKITDLGNRMIDPLVRLVKSTHPVLDRLFCHLQGTALSGDARRDFIKNRDAPRAVAANQDRELNRFLLNRNVSPRLRKEVLDKFGLVCHICGEGIPSRRDAHIDHIKPVSMGGLTELANLRPAHVGCNLKKGAGPKVILPESREPAKQRKNWHKVRSR